MRLRAVCKDGNILHTLHQVHADTTLSYAHPEQDRQGRMSACLDAQPVHIYHTVVLTTAGMIFYIAHLMNPPEHTSSDDMLLERPGYVINLGRGTTPQIHNNCYEHTNTKGRVFSNTQQGQTLSRVSQAGSNGALQLIILIGSVFSIWPLLPVSCWAAAAAGLCCTPSGPQAHQIAHLQHKR